MNELYWMDACARRLTELSGMTPESADRVAMRIWHTAAPVCFRQLHPVAAAEAWYAGATSGPAAGHAAALAREDIAT